MSDGHDHDRADDPRDESLRALLRDSPTPPSAEHDAAVLAAAERAADEIAAARRQGGANRSWLRRPWWGLAWLVPAAALLALLAVAPGWLGDTAGQAGLTDDRVRGAAESVVPNQGARLAEPPAAFRWPAVTDAAAYRLMVRDAGAAPLWESPPLDAPACPVGAPLRRALGAPGTYLWTVSAETPAGPVELGPYWFAIEE